MARRTQIRGGDARTGGGSLVRRRQAAGPAGGALLRRRLPAAVHLRPAAAAQARLGRRAQPQGRRLRPLRQQRRSDDRGRLGDRLAHDRPLRPDHRRQRHPEARSERVAADPAARIRRSGEELLLPGRQVRRDRDRRGRKPPATSARRPRSPATPSATPPSNWRASRSSARPASPAWPKTWRWARAGPGCRRRRAAAWPRGSGRSRSGRSRRRGRRRHRRRRSPR